MFRPIVAFIIFALGLAAGYAVRASISRSRLAMAREQWLLRREQKMYDEGIEPNSPGCLDPRTATRGQGGAAKRPLCSPPRS